VRIVATGADRRERIAVFDKRGMDAVAPLRRLIRMAGGADFGALHRESALALDRHYGAGVLGGIDVAMAGGTAEHAVHGLAEIVAMNL